MVDCPEILIAGCGTGQHPISASARFQNSNVLAIDLSLSSLAYAKRKTEELKITNIEFRQADILSLKELNKQFDIIESVGVLHHMNNPISGWKILVDCLKKGGVMKIGLYSELARQDVIQIQKEIISLGLQSNKETLKNFRDLLINSKKVHHKRIHNWSDFYSLSEFRDLLFHVKEKCFNLSKIQQILYDLNLKFCGFEINEITGHFRQSNKNHNDLYDLNKWVSYEEKILVLLNLCMNFGVRKYNKQ